ncbi:hypothetical protein P9E43_08065, partial [Bacillus subtilis]|nr:hypothetical protein [Bacillus subtilis]
SKIADGTKIRGGNEMEKVKVNHLWLVEDGKRFEEEIDAINIGNGYVLIMTNGEDNEHLVVSLLTV